MRLFLPIGYFKTGAIHRQEQHLQHGFGIQQDQIRAAHSAGTRSAASAGPRMAPDGTVSLAAALHTGWSVSMLAFLATRLGCVNTGGMRPVPRVI